MIHALNYSTHAIESLKEKRSAMAGKGHELEPIYGFYSDLLRKSEKFTLPENGDLLDTSSLRSEFFDLMRLPFPVVALELPVRGSRDYDQAIILAMESDGLIYVWTLGRSSVYGWGPTDYTFVVDPSAAAIQVRSGEVPSFKTFPLLKECRELKDLGEQASWDLHVLTKFCCTVNCENVTSEYVPAPERLNNKRAASNKEQFSSFHFLRIPERNNKSGAQGGGTHESPRLHLRRGHLRRLRTGQTVWVRHCLVGNPDKGVVEKLYQVA